MSARCKMWNTEMMLEQVLERTPASLKRFANIQNISAQWSNHWKTIQEHFPPREYRGKPIGYYYPDEALVALDKWLPQYFKYLTQKKEEEEKSIEYKKYRKSFSAMPEEALNTDNKFSNKNICFTGFSDPDKKNIAIICQQLNITQKNSVTSKCDYVVCSWNAGPSKKAKAESLGIPTVHANDFIEVISTPLP